MERKEFMEMLEDMESYWELLNSDQKVEMALGMIRMLNKGELLELLRKSMGLKALDQVVFHQDETKPQDWYIEKVKKGGYVLRDVSTKSDLLGFGNKGLIKQILQSCNCQDPRNSYKLRIGTSVEHDGMTLWPIITAPIVNKG